MTLPKIKIHYQVSMPFPSSHLFTVRLNIEHWAENQLNLIMPVWTPGSYLVRDYAKNLQSFQVTSDNQDKLTWAKVTKNHWQINTNKCSNLTVEYQVYSNELTVRTNHLDNTHGFFTGAALFMYVLNYENYPYEVAIALPKKHWQISTSLPKVKDKINTFIADNFDTLVDSPFEIGEQETVQFKVENKPHKWVNWGKGNVNKNQVIEDTKKIIATESKIFNGLPYDEYLFILHLSASGFGGLEHKNCCVLNYPRFDFKNTEKYHRFIQLVAHEFFHLWNVKRIRPKPLEKFNYNQENYTTSLWFSEGTTSYYDLLIPLRAGIYSQKIFLQFLSREISQYLSISGRKIQGLAESSFDAWIKLYRRDAYSNNNQISYYLKGELVTLILDLLIRNKHHNLKSFDDVMKNMWLKFGREEIGFTPEDLKREIEIVAEEDLSKFFHLYLETTTELPFNEYLEPFGLKLVEKEEKNPLPYLGLKVQKEGGIEKIMFVEADSPAGKVGIDAGDELIALDDFRVTAETLNLRLENYRPNDIVKLTVFHQDELRHFQVTLANPVITNYEVKVINSITKAQKENLAKWLVE